MNKKQPYPPAGLFTKRSAALAIFLGSIALVLLYVPIIGLILLSFSEQPLSGIPWPLTFEWYTSLLEGENARWVGPLGTSIMIGVLVAITSTTAALLIGRVIPLVRKRGGLLAAYLSVVILPGILVGIATLVFYRGLLGIRTGFWSVFLVHFIWALPFALLCILLVTVRFDRRLCAAASDLGATRLRQFLDIELPLLMPGISASLFFSFLLSFNELPRTLYARGSVITLPYYLWTASSSHSSQVSLIYALSAIITAGSFIFTFAAMSWLNKSR